MKTYTYLLLDIGTLFFPFILSFDKKVAFYKYWKSLFPAIMITATVFIVWDVWFTDQGVWEFNAEYITGIHIINLPLEEWLFFIVVPYACVFIYAVLTSYFTIRFNESFIKGLQIGLLASLLVLIAFNTERLYTVVNFALGALLLIIMFFTTNVQNRGWYFLSWLVSLLPFFLVNGALTAYPVVIYNNVENLSIRMLTIPVEDAIYAMNLLFMNYMLMDYFISRNKTRISPAS